MLILLLPFVAYFLVYLYLVVPSALKKQKLVAYKSFLLTKLVACCPTTLYRYVFVSVWLTLR
ncbi:hypothetical protein D7W09_06580 [bacterium D16-34]|nr:hypothetical protein D7W09_06580 [bacterium D16-34]